MHACLYVTSGHVLVHACMHVYMLLVDISSLKFFFVPCICQVLLSKINVCVRKRPLNKKGMCIRQGGVSILFCGARHCLGGKTVEICTSGRGDG